MIPGSNFYVFCDLGPIFVIFSVLETGSKFSDFSWLARGEPRLAEIKKRRSVEADTYVVFGIQSLVRQHRSRQHVRILGYRNVS